MVLTGQIHRYYPPATSGSFTKSVYAHKPWKTVFFEVPFMFVFGRIPTEILISDIEYIDCSDLVIEKISANSFRCSVMYIGSWGSDGNVTFSWEAIFEGEG